MAIRDEDKLRELEELQRSLSGEATLEEQLDTGADQLGLDPLEEELEALKDPSQEKEAFESLQTSGDHSPESRMPIPKEDEVKIPYERGMEPSIPETTTEDSKGKAQQDLENVVSKIKSEQTQPTSEQTKQAMSKETSDLPDIGTKADERAMTMRRYKQLISDIEKPREAPKGPHWGSVLADSLAGLYNLSVLGDRNLKPMQLNAIKNDLAMQQAGIKTKDKDFDRKKSYYEGYMKFLSDGDKKTKPMTEYEKGRLKEAQDRRALTERKFNASQRALLSKTLMKPQKLAEKLDTIDKYLGAKLDDLHVQGTNVYKDGEPTDLPGKSIWGTGRWTFHSSEARKLKAALEGVFNITLKDRSGAAVTTSELDRLRKEFNDGTFSTEGEIIGALKDFKKELYNEMRSREAVIDEEFLNKYKERGGRTSKGKGDEKSPKKEVKKTYNPSQEKRITHVMEKNGATREAAIKALKDANKI